MNETDPGSSRRRIGSLPHDPIPWLLSARDPAVGAFVRRDLLGEEVDVRDLWLLREPLRLADKQQPDGSWRYPVRKPPPLNYDLYETLNTLGVLVGKYGLDRRHPAVDRGAAYVFSCQSAEGDYRGIYGNQPAHTYTPALMEVLIQAGYQDHPPSTRPSAGCSARVRMTGGGPSPPGRATGGWSKTGRRWPPALRLQPIARGPSPTWSRGWCCAPSQPIPAIDDLPQPWTRRLS
jgi:hypothetical protein